MSPPISDLLESARVAVNGGRTTLDALGLREFTASLDLEIYNGPLRNGVTLLSTTQNPITPAPLVELLGGEEATWFGAGSELTDAGGKSIVVVYRISGITPEHSLGGYTLLQLMAKPASPSQRFVITLTGPGIPSLVRGGRPFQLAEAAKRESTLENSVVVKSAPVIHAAV